MKHLLSLLLVLFLFVGVCFLSSLKQSPPRNIADDAEQASFCCKNSDRSFETSDDGHTWPNLFSFYGDADDGGKIMHALLPGYRLMSGGMFFKLFKLKSLLSAELWQHLLWVCPMERTSTLHFTPNAIRYSCGYYIYGLARILI